MCIAYVIPVSYIIKNIYSSNAHVTSELYSHFWCLEVLYSQYEVLSHSVDFKAPRELSNPQSKTVSGIYHRLGRQSKCKCLQDPANFHKSLALQIVLVFNTVILTAYCMNMFIVSFVSPPKCIFMWNKYLLLHRTTDHSCTALWTKTFSDVNKYAMRVFTILLTYILHNNDVNFWMHSNSLHI